MIPPGGDKEPRLRRNTTCRSNTQLPWLPARANARTIHHFRAPRRYGALMTRSVQDEKRVTTAVRLTESLHARLQQAAAERDVSVNLIVSKAVSDYLDRLLPLDNALATR